MKPWRSQGILSIYLGSQGVIALNHALESTTQTLKYWLGVSVTSYGRGASLALFGHPSSDGVTINITYGVDDLLH